ncbi:histidine kinase [Mycobacterium sp. NPDC050551]|uniref:histidine kinase n=1 Tax=Mycobacterium sp. NPDC050551 TaxID=3155407 RepID=UPI00341776C9
MDLQPYVDAVRHELDLAARAGGPDAAVLADRLTAPLESALRLALLEALSEAAELITRELAPGSVDVRLRGRDPDFTVAPAEPPEPPPAPTGPDPDDEGGTWRVTLRLPENMRPGVDAAARETGVSVNAWLVRSVAAALAPQRGRPRTSTDKSFSGWVR